MQIKPEQLPARLERTGLASVYIISGDEPLQLMECADLVRMRARSEQFEERVVLDVDSNFDWNMLLAENSNASLFATRKLIELRLNNKPGKEGAAALIEYVEQASPDNVLLIQAARIDKQTQKSRWFGALEKAGIAIQVWPVETKQLPAWIKQRVRRIGKTIDAVAAELIAERVEGNLLAASQEIDKLCLLINHENISVDDVNRAVVDSARYDIFELITCALNSDHQRTRRILHGLRAEVADPASVYGAISWDFRRLCSIVYDVEHGKPFEKSCMEHRVWNAQRKTAIRRSLPGLTLSKLYQLLQLLVIMDRKIKSSDRDIVWEMLGQFLLSLTGKSPFSLQNSYGWR